MFTAAGRAGRQEVKQQTLGCTAHKLRSFLFTDRRPTPMENIARMRRGVCWAILQHTVYIHCTLLLYVLAVNKNDRIITLGYIFSFTKQDCQPQWLSQPDSPSTVPILLVRTESVWSSQPPPHKPSLNRLSIDWLESSTTRINRAAVTVLEWRCSSMNIRSQSKPSVRTSSSQALWQWDGEQHQIMCSSARFN